MINKEQVIERAMSMRPQSIEILKRQGNTFDLRVRF